MNIRLAILDLYDETENLGMDGIRRVVEHSGIEDYDVFDVRAKEEVPDLSYDIYISSGGPGDPRKAGEPWEESYYNFLDELWQFNTSHPARAKHMLFICHSFQMACGHFQVGEITERKSQSFGVFPVHRTVGGKDEWLFKGLDDPFYVADFRFYQVVQPDMEVLKRMGAKILLKEKIRPHVPLERAVMGIRFSDEIVGLQFHPEAHAAGMVEHFYKKTIQEKVLELKGEQKFAEMIELLGDPSKLEKTHKTIIPRFLKNAIEKVQIRKGVGLTSSASN